MAITVAVRATEDLSAAERSRISELCNAANDTDAFRDLFVVYVPSGGRHFVGFDRDGVLASHAVITTRWVQPGGYPPLRTAFVDAVATDPSRQHAGLSTEVMRRLGREIDDFDLGCLQTDLRGFYERVGWEHWRGPLAGRREGELVPTSDQRGVMVLRLPSTPPLDLDAQLSIEWQPHRFWE
jgi:aminoglycoside 2'-N-acetyltransferase I